MIVGPGYEPIPIEDLAIGQIVNVWGGFDEVGNIAAYKVEGDQKATGRNRIPRTHFCY